MGKTVVLRGGYAISSYLEGTGTNLRMPLNPPFESEFQTNYNTPSFTLPGSTLDQGLSALNPKNPYVGATIRLWDPGVRPAESQQWNLSTEYQFAGDNVLTVGYVELLHSTHLMVAMPYLQNMLVNGAVVQGPYLSGNPTLLLGDLANLGDLLLRQPGVRWPPSHASQTLEPWLRVSGRLHLLERHVGFDRLLRRGRSGGKPVRLHGESV